MQRKKLMCTPIRRTRADVPDLPEREQNHRINLCYDAHVDKSTGEDVLVIDFYLPKDKTLHKRLFLNGERWFTEYADGTVSRESLKINGEYYRNYSYTPINDWCDMKIKSFMFGVAKAKKHKLNEHSAMEMISDYQDRIREKNLEDKYNRIKDSISREMLEISPTPDKFTQWVDKEIMPKYIFYIYSKNKRVTAHCSYCGEEVTIERPHKDDVVKCPHCRQICTAKPLRLYNNSAGFNDSKKNVIYLQPLKNNRMCIRKYNIIFRYYSTNTKTIKEYFESTRTFARLVKGSLIEESTYMSDSNYRGGDWRREFYTNYSPEGNIYPATLNQIFKKCEGFKQYHIDYNKIARKCGTLNVAKLYYASVNVNSLMNLVNSGLYCMGHDVIDLAHVSGVDIRKELKNVHYTNSGALKKAFGITKDDLPALKHINPTLEQYDVYVKLKDSGKLPDRAELKRFFQICDNMNAGSGRLKMLIDHLISHSTIHQFVKYYDWLRKTRYFDPNNSVQHYYSRFPEMHFLTDYFDYIGFAKLLEMNLRDLNVLYPRDFKKAHDSLSDIVNSKEFKAAELPQIARQFDKYNQMFGYAYKDLLIVPPKRHNDIKSEGETLKHCVATYAKRVATGETIILFVRKATEPNKPFFTLNIEPGTYEFVQCRGLKNCHYPNEVKALLARWYQEKIEPLRRKQQQCLKTA